MENTTPRELTYGEKAVGLTFNPSQDPSVDSIKARFAVIIDQLHDIRINSSTSMETKRLCSLAITDAQVSQMWAVKAITWKD